MSVKRRASCSPLVALVLPKRSAAAPGRLLLSDWLSLLAVVVQFSPDWCYLDDGAARQPTAVSNLS